MGNDGEIFELDDGSFWQVKYEYEYMYEYYPNVVICPSRRTLIVGRETLNVEPVGAVGTPGLSPSGSVLAAASVIESRINGEFTGWDGDTVFLLLNGQIWQQSSYAYLYHYAYGPEVLIYRSGSVYKMRVEGVDGEIAVSRLN
jgi:hypothetical protein